MIHISKLISDPASKPQDYEDAKINTVFILAMNLDEVSKNLGNQLKKINESNDDPQRLGSLYIEKLVQLIVPIPYKKK